VEATTLHFGSNSYSCTFFRIKANHHHPLNLYSKPILSFSHSPCEASRETQDDVQKHTPTGQPPCWPSFKNHRGKLSTILPSQQASDACLQLSITSERLWLSSLNTSEASASAGIETSADNKFSRPVSSPQLQSTRSERSPMRKLPLQRCPPS